MKSVTNKKSYSDIIELAVLRDSKNDAVAFKENRSPKVDTLIEFT